LAKAGAGLAAGAAAGVSDARAFASLTPAAFR
jgi:hypothetical protein